MLIEEPQDFPPSCRGGLLVVPLPGVEPVWFIQAFCMDRRFISAVSPIWPILY